MPRFVMRSPLLAKAFAAAAMLVALCGSQVLADNSPQFDKACSQMQEKHFDDAILSLTEAIANDPKDAMSFFRRGQCFYCLNRYKESVADFDRAIAIEPEVASFFLWRGTALAKNSDDEGAVRDYEKAMRLNPGLVVAFNDTQSKDQHPLNSATATEPAPASGEFKKGTIDLGYNAKAMEDYAEAVKRAGVKSTAFFRPGAVYSGLCELDLQGKLIGNPMDSTAEGTVGKRNGSDYFTLKNPTKDMREADDQISQNPEAAKWYYSRARSYEQLGHDELAVKDLTRAIDLDQKNAMYFLARSFLYHKLSKKDLSEADLRSALDLDPSLPRLVSFEPPKNVKIEAKATQ